MEVKVRFRFNKATGEVELFEVDDIGPMVQSEADHNRTHDEITAKLGRVLEQNPEFYEVLPGSEPIDVEGVTEPAEPEATTEQTPEQDRQRATE